MAQPYIPRFPPHPYIRRGGIHLLCFDVSKDIQKYFKDDERFTNSKVTAERFKDIGNKESKCTALQTIMPRHTHTHMAK